MGKIFYLMGKSSSGKDTIYKRLMADTSLGLKNIVLYTTRPIRQGERDGMEYYFVDEKISVEKREQMWLLTRDSYVLWLVGGRISEDVKVTEQTQFITEIENIGGQEHGSYKKT